MVAQPEDHPWSSYEANANVHSDSLLLNGSCSSTKYMRRCHPLRLPGQVSLLCLQDLELRLHLACLAQA